MIHMWLSKSGTASETADVCKVPFRRETAGAVTDADLANISPESDSSEYNATLRSYMQQVVSLKWTAVEIWKIWVQYCDLKSHPPAVPLLLQSYCLIAMNSVYTTTHKSAKYG